MVVAAPEKPKTYGIPAEWARDIVQCADDFGWGVESLGPVRVVLSRERTTLTIESIFINAHLVASILRPPG